MCIEDLQELIIFSPTKEKLRNKIFSNIRIINKFDNTNDFIFTALDSIIVIHLQFFTNFVNRIMKTEFVMELSFLWTKTKQ